MIGGKINDGVRWSCWLLFISCMFVCVTALALVQRKDPDPGIVFTGKGILAKSDPSSTKPEYLPNEIIIKIRPSFIQKLKHSGETISTGAALDKVLAKYKIRKSKNVFHPLPNDNPQSPAARSFSTAYRESGLDRIYLLKTEASFDVIKAVEDFRKLPEIEYAEPEFIYHAQMLPNDPYLTSQNSWGQDYADLWGLYKISAPEAWDIATGMGVVVAVVDTGCDRNHPDLENNIWSNPGEIPDNGLDDDNNGYVDDSAGWSFVDGNNDFTDRYGHGTHVSGTIAAVANNGIGIAGLAWNAKIMSVKGLDDTGVGYNNTLAAAIVYAAQSGARVINMSWGGPGVSQVIQDALSLAYSMNVVLVAAAGNSANDASGFFPAASRYVITVGSTDRNDFRSDFSNFGASVDVMAPGGDSAYNTPNAIFNNILSLHSSTIGSSGLTYPDLVVESDYMRLRGTSMAAPHVSGLCALLLEKLPSASPEEIRQILRLSADDIDMPGWDIESAYGRINAAAAIALDTLGSARILSPMPSTISANRLELRITASAPDFLEYQLEYSESSKPDTWVQIARSSVPLIKSTALDWNIELLPDSTYMIHLRVSTRSGMEFQDRLEFTLDRVSISSPSKYAAFRAGQTIKIQGTASGGNFSKYEIRYFDPATGLGTTSGISLVNGGTRAITNGLLGTWNTSGIAAAGFYMVELVVKRHNLPNRYEYQTLIIDPTLHPGWPKTISDAGCGGFKLAYLDQLIAADIDRDGSAELLVGYGDEVLVFKGDGSSAPGWPQKINTFDPDVRVQISPAVGDLDGDGYPEIIAGNSMGRVFIWDHRGKALRGWPKMLLGMAPNISVADINNDGKPEMISTDWSGNISVFDIHGHFLRGWPYGIPGCIDGALSAPAVADLDGDGRKEIVAECLQDSLSIHVLKNDGSSRSGWPVILDPPAFEAWAHPVLADVDGDYRLEIISSTVEGRVFVFHPNGKLAPGWPKQPDDSYLSGGLAVADITGDKVSEILISIAGFEEDLMYAWDGSGNPVPGWPAPYGLPRERSYCGFGTAAVVDIDGDGKRDVIVDSRASYSSPFTLNGYSSNGQKLAGFPKPVSNIGAWPTNTPAIADFDGDGFIEIAWLDYAGDLYMWDTSTPYVEDEGNWSMFHHDPQRTGANGGRSARPLRPRQQSRNSNPAAGRIR